MEPNSTVRSSSPGPCETGAGWRRRSPPASSPAHPGRTLHRELQRPSSQRAAQRRGVRHRLRGPSRCQGLAPSSTRPTGPTPPSGSHPRRVRREDDHQPASAPVAAGPAIGVSPRDRRPRLDRDQSTRWRRKVLAHAALVDGQVGLSRSGGGHGCATLRPTAMRRYCSGTPRSRAVARVARPRATSASKARARVLARFGMPSNRSSKLR